MAEVRKKLRIYFSDFFLVSEEKISNYGAFNISLINDLPLFIDPFLLFNSKNTEYQRLHEEIIKYVLFLKTNSSGNLPNGLIKSWFYFPEIKENWLGYSQSGNRGRGLGPKFARALKVNLTTVFKNFGNEGNTGSHLEKLTLVKDGVGRDQISDFTCNLICGYLAEYTEKFATQHIDSSRLGKFTVPKVEFNYRTQTWTSKQFTLPKYGKEFVLLTPIDMLTKDEAWISHRGFVEDFSAVVSSVQNDQLRNQIDNYFASVLPIDANKEEAKVALEKVVKRYPEILDYYISFKERHGADAHTESAERVHQANLLFVEHLRKFVDLLDEKTAFYRTGHSSYDEAMRRLTFLKKVIEEKDGYRLFFVKGKPIKREQDLQIMFKLTWFASDFSFDSEVNNGRGPADFVVSYGSADKSVVEFKLASNTKLEKNLLAQAEIYASAAEATHPPIKGILYFSDAEFAKVKRLLAKHKLEKCKDIVLIDARDGKESASKAQS